MAVLLFGFEAYLGFTDNPSKMVVERLRGSVIRGHKVDGLVLPVEYGKVESMLLAKIGEVKPDVVIGLGLYPGLPSLGITKLAANFKFSQTSDNSGKMSVGELIDKNEPDGIFMTVDSEGLVAHLNVNSVPAMLLLASPDAYVCNLSMFVIAKQSKKSGFSCGFVHIPFTKESVPKNAVKSFASMDLATMVKGIETTIAYCIDTYKE